MATQSDHLTDRLKTFIAAQHMFFVATAARSGRVNVSPKGMDSLRVLSGTRLQWLNLTGSGNETAGHLRDTNRMTMMWCAFDGKPLILRVYGTATMLQPSDAGWEAAAARFPNVAGRRQIFDMEIEMVQTSCGMGVPVFAFTEDRVEKQLVRYFEEKGPEGTRAYQLEKNTRTMDGLSTGLDAELN